MKNIILGILLGIFLTGFSAFAALTEVDRAEFPIRSLDPNSGFESGKAGITASGGTLTTATSGSNLLHGKTSLVWDSTSAGQTLKGSTLTVPGSLQGKNGLAMVTIKATSNTATHLFQMVDQSGNTLNSMSITSNTASAVDHSLNFVFPTSGAVRWQVQSVASNEPTIALDDIYVGPAANISQVSQTQFVGMSYFAQTTNCSWSRTNTAIGAFGTDTDCPGPTVGVSKIGSWQTTDSDLPRQTINDLPEGLYSVEVTGSLYGSGDWTMAVSDGTTTSPAYCSGSGNGGGTFQPATTCIAWFEYTGVGNRSFEIYGSSSSGAISLDNNQNNDRTTFTIKRWDRNPSTFASINNTDTGWTDAGAMTITASTTNPTKGTMGRDKVFWKRDGQDLVAIYQFDQTSAGSGGSGEYIFALPAGLVADTNIVPATSGLIANGNGTSLQSSKIGVGHLANGSGARGRAFAFLSTSTTFRVLGEITFSQYEAFGSGFHGIGNTTLGFQMEIRVPIQGWTANQSTPVFVGSVSSNSTAAERIERAKITNSGTPTISSQSGSWISSLTDNGTGDTTINITSGMFSAAPTCVATGVRSSFAVPLSFETTISTSAIRVRTFDTSGSGAADLAFEIICMGPR